MKMRLVQGQQYRATIKLGLMERAVATNTMIADKLKAAGFVNVTVGGEGATRSAIGTWGKATADDVPIPSQVSHVERA